MGDNADQYVLISLRHLTGIYVNEKCFVELEKTEPKPAGKETEEKPETELPLNSNAPVFVDSPQKQSQTERKLTICAVA